MKSKLISGFRLRLQVLFYNRLKHITMSCGEGCRISGLHLSSCGKNNKIVLGDNVTLDNVTVSIFGSNNRIVIRGNNHVAGIRLAMEDDGNTIEIGKHNFIGSGSLLAALEGTRIEIGDDCMIAGHCEIRTSDSHSLLDAGGKRINCARDIILGGAYMGRRGNVDSEGCDDTGRLRRCGQVCGLRDERCGKWRLPAGRNTSEGLERKHLMEP